MKKTLLLSVVASTMIMAGGDIAPVEPVVEAPVAQASGWEFGGKGVVYYQTNDTIQNSGAGIGDLFKKKASAADAGVQLRATNADLFAGVGAGVEVNGLATLNLENFLVSNVMQSTNGALQGGWISQMYLTYGIGNTSLKAGRQTLPKSLSPFAYSENWNVFENTFDSVLVVNTDLPDTTLVGAWVYANNANAMHADMASFPVLNHDNGVYMLTAQNKSLNNLTLTGSWYYGQDFVAPGNDINILWGDATYDAGNFGVGIQGGTVLTDAANDMSAFGAKLTGAVMGLNGMLAYSTVSDGSMFQVAGTTSALYTGTALDQVVGTSSFVNEDKFVATLGADALGGNITGVFASSTSDATGLGDYNEFDLVYSANLTENLNLTGAYVYGDVKALSDNVNLVRLVASYKF